jgi:hypothetical protein
MPNQDIRVPIIPAILPPLALPAPGERKQRPAAPRKPRAPAARRFPGPSGIAHIDEYADAPCP